MECAIFSSISTCNITLSVYTICRSIASPSHSTMQLLVDNIMVIHLNFEFLNFKPVLSKIQDSIYKLHKVIHQMVIDNVDIDIGTALLL